MKEPSLEKLVELYEAHCRTRMRPLTWESYADGLRQMLGFLASRGNPLRRAADIRVSDAEAFAAWKQQARAGPRTVNKLIAAVRRMLNWAVAHDPPLIRANPLARWKPLKQERKRRQRRSLTEFEMTALLKQSPPYLADIWRFMLVTGLRSRQFACGSLRDPRATRACRAHKARRDELLAANAVQNATCEGERAETRRT